MTGENAEDANVHVSELSDRDVPAGDNKKDIITYAVILLLSMVFISITIMKCGVKIKKHPKNSITARKYRLNIS